MNDDLTSLASAYLDGEVTSEERALVESDPSAASAVERLRRIRVMLGDAETPAISTREQHLAAALDAWDRLLPAERAGVDSAAAAGAASVTSARSFNDRRRKRSTYWLNGAAAAMVAVLVGGVALQLLTSNSDDMSSNTSTAFDAATGPAPAPRSSAEGVAAESDTGARSATDAGVENTESDSEINAGIDSEIDTMIDNAAPSGDDPGLAQLQNTGDLADFASYALEAPVAPDNAPAATSSSDDSNDSAQYEAPFPACLGVDLIVGPALYGDVAVVVGIDESQGTAIAYEAATCAEVARVRLP